MINDDERDYAEERANLADMRREAEGEAAFEALAGRVVSALRTLSTETHDDARASVARLAEEVELRLPPNLHRYELLARQQHTALLAAIVASGIEEGIPGYDLVAAARGAVIAYRVTHSAGLHERGARHLNEAADRVVAAVQTVLDEDEQQQQDARDAADYAETERHLLRVTR